MVEALVEHDYVAKESDELTIRKGDIIKDVVRKSGGWWEGVLNDKKGMFPDNFVKVLERDHGVVYRTKKVRQCKAIFSYKQDHEDELTLNVGDVIDVLGEEEEGWWRGFLHGKEGVFPSNFVEEIASAKSKSKAGSREDLSGIYENETKTPNLPPKPTPSSETNRNLNPLTSLGKTLCEVRYSYRAQNDDELSLKEGDVITLVSKDGPDMGWWKGELNGQIGVFPDNFVIIIPTTEDRQPPSKDDRKSSKVPHDPQPLKPSAIVSQRKSLEVKADTENKAFPPVVSKKPSLPLKKSPTSSGSSLFSGLRKKVVDAVDGSAGSKSQSQPPTGKYEPKPEKASDMNDNDFDHIERNSLLQDVRASRPKAPAGRRLPTIVFKEGEVGILNGNTEHSHLDSTSENTTSTSTEEDVAEVKPKVREWEKHKAPWLEEMKLNQAKRTSPGPEQSKVKLPTGDKNASPDFDESKSTKTSPYEKDSSPVDMTKSMPSLSTKLKTPPNELEKNTNPVLLRNKPTVQQPLIRPQTISHVSPSAADTSKLTNAANPVGQKISPHLGQNNRPTGPVGKLTTFEKADPKASGDTVPDSKVFGELLDRIQKLELIVERQNQAHLAAIEELRCKLKVESELRIALQADLEKVAQSQVMHL